MPLGEEVGEADHPLAHVGGRERRLRVIGEEAAHEPDEPCVVVGVPDDGGKLPQRRRTPQELLRKAAQERRGRSFHCMASSSRPVAEA